MFASNIEVCETVTLKKEEEEKELEKKLIETPNIGVIEDLEKAGFDIKKLTKTLIYKADDKFYAVVVPGDREVNELKIRKVTESKNVELATREEVEKITGAKLGFAGPIGLDIPIIIDSDVALMKNFLVGANKTDYHYINVNLKDIENYEIADIKEVKEGDFCPLCKNKLSFKKGIEVGNTFKLGDKYSRTMNLTYLDKDNKEQYPIMGCYGIGLERILASVAEQRNDDKGLSWPISIAPFKVAIVLLNQDGEEYANNLYDTLNREGIDTLLDDRDERPGVKFNDMDLIGIPIRITIGKKFNENIVELKLRDEKEVKEIITNSVLEEIKKVIDNG